MKTREEIENQLCNSIVSALAHDLHRKGKASLLVSGGSTPTRLFNLLSKVELDWENVFISLVDDRFLEDNHSDQNGRMVKELLLINEAESATFIPLVQDASEIESNLSLLTDAFTKIPLPFSAVILGMGDDGHTASLFPDCDELIQGMDFNNQEQFIITNPKAAPYQRISLTRNAILNCNNLFLHFYGEEKMEVFEKASKNDNYLPYPIEGFIHQEKVELQVLKTK